MQVRRVQIIKKASDSSSDLKASEVDELQSQQQQQQDRFLNFVVTYSDFLSDAHNTNLDLNLVQQDLNQAINSYAVEKYQSKLYRSESLRALQDTLVLSKDQIDKFAQQLRQMPESTLYQCVQYVEKINVKLALDQSVELKRAKQLQSMEEE